MSQAYSNLLSAGRIGSLDLKNRMIVSAMGTILAETDGHCGPRLSAFHEAQAKGGASLIISGVCGVAWPTGAVIPNQTAISDDKFLPGLTRMVERVHAHGAKIAAQLHHGGMVAGYSADAFDVPIWAPCYPTQMAGDFVSSFLPEELGAFIPKKPPQMKILEKDDIQQVVSQFAAAAGRAQKAGFDGVEIHSAHGYLLSSFISPKTNTRTDEYGGPLENRVRFLLEVIAAIRAEVGPNYPVWCKLDSAEFGKEGGISLEDAITTAKLAEAAGVDAITVSSYHNAAIGKLHSGSNIPHVPETNIPATKAIKAAVGIPVIGSGRVELENANEQIGEGQYDFLAMGRKVLADPTLPNKIAEGRADLIRPCVYCYTCVSAIYAREPVRCAVNPSTGLEFAQKPLATTGKNYVVIGGGPGGMESACQLAEAGNTVTLFEKSKQLGGTLRFASLAYPPNERLLNWLIARVKRLGINVKLGTEVTPELLAGLQPDAIIVATGGRRDMPDIKGSHLDHVFSGDDMRNLILGQASQGLNRKTSAITRLATRIGAATGLTADLGFVRKVSHQWMPLGENIAIIGGELVGVELAEFLQERGRQVSLIEPSANFGRGLMLVRRARILSELREHGVSMHANAREIEITKDAVSYSDKNGERQSVGADHVIVAMGATEDTALAESIKALGYNVQIVGDANGIGYIEGAIHNADQAVIALSA